MNDLEQTLYAKGYRIRTVNGREEWYKAEACGVPPAAQQESNLSHDTVAADKGASSDAGFRVVRITSFRQHLLDERNLWDAYFTDSLVKSGLLRDDSPTWCKIEVTQQKVYRWEDERTEIEITGS